MKNIHRIALATATMISLAALIFIVGCESNKEYKVEVSPPYADLTEGSPRVTLSAKGWSDFTWKLEDTKIGFLSSTHGESVIYTGAAFSESKTQTVTAYARNIIIGGSNNVSRAYQADAIIRHIPKSK